MRAARNTVAYRISGLASTAGAAFLTIPSRGSANISGANPKTVSPTRVISAPSGVGLVKLQSAPEILANPPRAGAGRGFDRRSASGTIWPVRMKLILLLACAALVVRSGPLPACLWDEAIESLLSTPEAAESSESGSPSVSALAFLLPQGDDDTSDEVSRDMILQQSMGNLQQASASLHDSASAGGMVLAALPRSWDSCRVLSTFAVSVYPPPGVAPPPPIARYNPLLI